MSHNDWLFYNTFSGWASAMTTLLAVIVSLWLATRDNRVKLKVDASIVVLATQGDDPKRRQRYVSVAATNTGYGPVRVTGLFWQVGLFKRKHFMQLPPANPFSSQLPRVLVEGEVASIYFETALFTREAFPYLSKALGSSWPKLTLRRMKAGFTTSVGKSFKATINKSLRDWLASALLNSPATGSRSPMARRACDDGRRDEIFRGAVTGTAIQRARSGGRVARRRGFAAL
jgi:hypothetical protein